MSGPDTNPPRGEIEFVDAEPTPGDTEYLPQPSRHGSAIGRGPRVAVGAGITLLVGGLLVARAVTSNDGTPVAAPASSLSTVGAVATGQPSRSAVVLPAPQSASSSLALDPDTGLIVSLKHGSCFPSNQIGSTVRFPEPAGAVEHCVKVAPAQCPESDDGQIACLVVRALPARVLDAVRVRYPHAHVTFAYTEIARQTELIWYRVIRLSIAPKVSILITLEQSGFEPGESGVVDGAARQQVHAVSSSGGLNTIVDLIAPNGTGANLGLPTALASDSRLAAIS